jgi:cytochrome c553
MSNRTMMHSRHSRFTRTYSLIAGILMLFPAAALHAESNFPPDAPLSADVCMTCHGGYGQGSEVVGGPKLAGMEPWYIKRQLMGFRSGFRGTATDYIPAFEMRATAASLSDIEIDTVVADIAQWPDVALVPTLEGDVAAGEGLYGPCAACHGATAEGNQALGAPALAGRNDWYLLRQLELFAKGERGMHADDAAGQQMRAMMSTLSDADSWHDVLAYISSLTPAQ